jgi:hypothetical protein
MKRSSLIVEIHHQAGVDAANAAKMKQCELIDFKALQGSQSAKLRQALLRAIVPVDSLLNAGSLT